MWWAPLLQMPMWTMMTLRGNWTPRFPRAWRGRKITVVIRGRTYQSKMERIARDNFAQLYLPCDGWYLAPPAFYFKDEGVTWCMGHKGKRVDAFRVAVALGAVLES